MRKASNFVLPHKLKGLTLPPCLKQKLLRFQESIYSYLPNKTLEAEYINYKTKTEHWIPHLNLKKSKILRHLHKQPFDFLMYTWYPAAGNLVAGNICRRSQESKNSSKTKTDSLKLATHHSTQLEIKVLLLSALTTRLIQSLKGNSTTETDSETLPTLVFTIGK